MKQPSLPSSSPIPPVLGEYDIIVCGGGMAGCGAAVAAARAGANVLLVERLEMLGGLGSAGGVGNFCAAEGGLRGQGRVFDDILDGLRRHHAIGEEHGWPTRRNEQLRRENWTFDHRFLPLVLQGIALDAGSLPCYPEHRHDCAASLVRAGITQKGIRG